MAARAARRPTAGAPARPAIGIVGLGIMGGAMGESLCSAGYAVCGYDVAAARERLKRAGGRALGSAGSVAEQSDVLIVSLATVAALEQVTAALAAARRPRGAAPLIVIETSTLPLADKDRTAERLTAAGMVVLDCPISGTAVRLRERTWTIFVSGPQAAAREVEPVLRVFTDNAPYVGRYGHGTRMKYIANHLVAILNVATAESLTFARKMGLDPQQVLDLFGPSPVVGTGVMRLRGRQMVAREYLPPTMKVEVWQKDMQVIGDMAKSVDCPVPLFAASAPVYTAAMAQGLAQSDTASVCEVLGSMAGIAPRAPAPVPVPKRGGRR